MMVEGLNLTLPEGRRRRPWGNGWVIVLLLAVLALGGVNLWLQLRGQGPSQRADGALDAGRYEQLATKLAARSLHAEAAEAWRQYLDCADVGAHEQAQVLYRIGALLLEAGKPMEAVDYFYRSELTADLPELRAQLDQKLAEAFEQAGRFAALRQELRTRASFKPTDDGDSVVVAQIGPEKITRGQLAALVEKKLDSQLRRFAAMMPPEQAKQQKEAMLGRMADPKQQLQLLEQVLAEEAFYREALARQLDDEAAVKEALTEQRRSVLAQELLDREVLGKVQVGERDMETYYQAHQGDFVQPAQASIRYVAFSEETAAADFIGRLQGGENFTTLAKTVGEAGQTRDGQGAKEAQLVAGRPATGPTLSQEWQDRILAAEPNTLIAEPVGQGADWYAVWVDEVTAPQQQDFAGVKDQIYQTLTRQKMQDAQQALQESLMAKYNIVVHREAFAGASAARQDNSVGTPAGP